MEVITIINIKMKRKEDRELKVREGRMEQGEGT